MSLTKAKGFVMSKDNLPVGSFNGGNTFGGSLPKPFGFFSDSVNGNNSKEHNTCP